MMLENNMAINLALSEFDENISKPISSIFVALIDYA